LFTCDVVFAASPEALLVDDLVVTLLFCDTDSVTEEATEIGSVVEVVTRVLDNGVPVPLERTLVFDKEVATWMLDDDSIILVMLLACVVAEEATVVLVTT